MIDANTTASMRLITDYYRYPLPLIYFNSVLTGIDKYHFLDVGLLMQTVTPRLADPMY